MQGDESIGDDGPYFVIQNPMSDEPFDGNAATHEDASIKHSKQGGTSPHGVQPNELFNDKATGDNAPGTSLKSSSHFLAQNIYESTILALERHS